MANNFVKKLDRQQWVSVSPAPNAHAAGMGIAVDLRNDNSHNPYIGQLVSATVMNRYNIVQKAWNFVGSPALAGTYGAGAGAVFAPSCGQMGSIGAGCTTTSIVTTTVLGASIAVNQLSDKGDGYGFRIRIKGNSSGGSGLTEERMIIANTGGVSHSPTIILDSALTFTPQNGDTYEILGGRYFGLSAGALASGIWKNFDAVHSGITTCSNTNLPATIGTEFSALALDELYVPYDRTPGEGFLGDTALYNNSEYDCLQATGSAAGTITGQASGGDASVLQNEYRNFQIRIVEDTARPTSVGQRRIIASHTAGANPIYTLGSNWSVTPSTNAKFTIEYPNLIILRNAGNAVVYTYNYSGASINNGTTTLANDAWSNTYFGNAPAVMSSGCTMFPSFGIQPDSAKNSRHSFIFCFRGGGSSLDLLDIAGGASGSWSSASGIPYDGAVAIGAGTCGKYAPACCQGRYGYMNIYTASAANQMFRFDVKNRILAPIASTDWIQTGTATNGDRVATFPIIYGADKYTGILLVSHLSTISFELIVQV